MEVKTPVDFRGPLSHSITHGAIVKHIERLLNDAASTKSGQFDPNASGILAIGSFNLGPRGIGRLEQAANEVLARQRTRKPHVVGIGLFDASYTEINSKLTTVLQPILEVRFARHPNYKGSVTIESGQLAVPTMPQALYDTLTKPAVVAMNRAQRRALDKKQKHR